jgi:hypothetical protein
MIPFGLSFNIVDGCTDSGPDSFATSIGRLAGKLDTIGKSFLNCLPTLSTLARTLLLCSTTLVRVTSLRYTCSPPR